MKRNLILSLLFTLLSTGLMAQTATGVDGIWLGTLKVQMAELRLGFTFSVDDDGTLSALMTSIDQGNAEVAMQEVTLKGDLLVVKHPPILMEIEGKLDLDKGTWDCEFKQSTVTAPLLFKRVDKLPVN